jgi:hypothetical protein
MSFGHERTAQLLASLPPAPRGWVEAAQELPFLRPRIDEILARPGAPSLEAALAEAGIDVSPELLRLLRAQLRSD